MIVMSKPQPSQWPTTIGFATVVGRFKRRSQTKKK
jgi:hypothetical protein